MCDDLIRDIRVELNDGTTSPMLVTSQVNGSLLLPPERIIRSLRIRQCEHGIYAIQFIDAQRQIIAEILGADKGYWIFWELSVDEEIIGIQTERKLNVGTSIGFITYKKGSLQQQIH